MSRFYIKKISVSDENGTSISTVEFGSQVNIIHGPSNCGKSYIISCINFMFGSKEVPFSKDRGYNTVSMRLENGNGDFIIVERKIIDGKNGEIGSSSAKITSSVAEVQSKEYTKEEYRTFLLSLMGIKEPHKLISNTKFKPENLSLRSIFHFFFMDEINILKKETAFKQPKFNKIVLSITALHFMFTGEDLHELFPAEDEKTQEEKRIRKSGIAGYLKKKIDEKTKEYQEMLKLLELDENTDINILIENAVREIRNINEQILTASEKSQNILSQIYRISSELEKSRFLLKRYQILHTQYTADIERLQFIIDGEQKSHLIPKMTKCPYCDSNMPENTKNSASYTEAAKKELNRIHLQIQDLQEAENDITQEIQTFESELQELSKEKDIVINLIDTELKPKSDILERTVQKYKDLLIIIEILKELTADAQEHQSEDESEKPSFNAREKLSSSHWQALSDQFNTMVKDCAYPNQPDSIISLETLDAVVNKKHKKDEGKGYRAFLNTLMLFNLMKYLEKEGKYSLHMLFLDSPILSLKDKKDENEYAVAEEERATPQMRESLFTYMIENCGENQVIIAENELPENVDYSKVNLIEFTRDENNGRYGFFKDYKKA